MKRISPHLRPYDFPRLDDTEGKLAIKPFCVKLPVVIMNKLQSMDKAERTKITRKAIIDAVNAYELPKEGN